MYGIFFARNPLTHFDIYKYLLYPSSDCCGFSREDNGRHCGHKYCSIAFQFVQHEPYFEELVTEILEAGNLLSTPYQLKKISDLASSILYFGLRDVFSQFIFS